MSSKLGVIFSLIARTSMVAVGACGIANVNIGTSGAEIPPPVSFSPPNAQPNSQSGGGPSPGQVEFFETKIRPQLAANCFQCHSSSVETPLGGLRLDSREALLTGGDSGPAIVPGRVSET